MTAAGLVLAAGAGRRFGADPKQLAEVRGRPLLQWAIDAQVGVPAVSLDPIVVVLGARAAEVAAGIDPGRAQVVVCADWAEGQRASLRCGLEALAGHEPVLVTLGDVPSLTPEIVERFVDAPPPTRALHRGRPGHPVVLGAAEIAAARADDGRGTPPRGLLRGARTVEIGHLCSGRDVDTPEDLEEVRDGA